ncbi:Spo0B domain-containing protein [Ornithinibacillus scapharcae]|uniref:Spo0B domain-containing protein n=1 Tax=Ornithinibacillus scapharcae TaxID=1147159 RepID=UPI000225BE86|nr:Spo0B domain-containing protein [Ornithinibacillus scapharcae]
MESKDVIQLLRLQRHDLMNDLQIVHGYLSMGKTEKVTKKVNEIIEAFNRERKLMNSNCPEFTLFLIQAKWLYNNIQITYDIHTEKSELQAFDVSLTIIGNAILEAISTEEFAVVEVELLLKDNHTAVEVEFTLEETYFQESLFRKKMSKELNEVLIKVQELGSKIIYTLTIPA